MAAGHFGVVLDLPLLDPGAGEARFTEAVAGVGHPGVCANAEFLNPSTGKKLLSVDWVSETMVSSTGKAKRPGRGRK